MDATPTSAVGATDSVRTDAAEPAPSHEDRPRVILVPIEALDVTFREQRRGAPPPPPASPEERLSELPLRVVRWTATRLLVVDGLKRLERWRASGMRRVPVVVEAAGSRAEARALLLAANAPRRTLTVMDEARVVHALRTEDRLGQAGIARLLGKRRGWVASRQLLAVALAPSVAARVDQGAVGVSLALALCGVAQEAQELLVVAAAQHRLTGGEALALVAAYRDAEDDRARSALLAAPLAVVRPARAPAPLGPLAARLAERLERIRAALADLAAFELPPDGLTPVERRRLEADQRRVRHQLRETARALGVEGGLASPDLDEDDDHERRRHDDDGDGWSAGRQAATPAAEAHPARADSGRAPADPGAGASRELARDRQAAGPWTQDRAPGAGRGSGDVVGDAPGGTADGADGARGHGDEARPLPRGDRRAREEGAHDHADPARDPGARLHGRPLDPGSLCAHAADGHEEGPCEGTLRDAPRGGLCRARRHVER